jgi:hypothetical protein
MRKTAVLLVALVLGVALLVLGLSSSGRASNWLLGAIGLQPDVVALGNLAFGDTPETIRTKLAGTSFFSQQGSINVVRNDSR